MTDEDAPRANRDTDQHAETLPVQRRTYMTLFAAGAVAASGAGAAQGGDGGAAATGDDVSPATSHGYGQGGYGTVPYGGQAGPPPIVNNQPPTDTDSDGLYEDIDGSGEFDIFDVQALFTHLNDDAVQNNAEYYRFQEGNTSDISIFDVQALFNELS